jgi:hypothetical protein
MESGLIPIRYMILGKQPIWTKAVSSRISKPQHCWRMLDAHGCRSGFTGKAELKIYNGFDSGLPSWMDFNIHDAFQ